LRLSISGVFSKSVERIGGVALESRRDRRRPAGPAPTIRTL
jgi:hypothetical protein